MTLWAKLMLFKADNRSNSCEIWSMQLWLRSRITKLWHKIWFGCWDNLKFCNVACRMHASDRSSRNDRVSLSQW